MNVSFWFGGAVRSAGGARRLAGIATLAIVAVGHQAATTHAAPFVDEAVAVTAAADMAGSSYVLKLGTFGLTGAQHAEFLNAVSSTDTYGGDRPAAPVTWFSAARFADGAGGANPTAGSGWHKATVRMVRGAKENCWDEAMQGIVSAPGDLDGVRHDAGDIYLRYRSATNGSEDESTRTGLEDSMAFKLTASFPMASAGLGNFDVTVPAFAGP